jgi:hypothetical protein
LHRPLLDENIPVKAILLLEFASVIAPCHPVSLDDTILSVFGATVELFLISKQPKRLL